MTQMSEERRDERTYAIIGAATEKRLSAKRLPPLAGTSLAW